MSMENNNLEMEEVQMPENLVLNASEIEKATFYRKTYMHVALAVLSFIVVEGFLLQSDVLVNLMLSMLDGYKWLIVLGLFWVGSAMSEKLAHSASRGTQYMGLMLFVVFEAIIFLPLIYIALAYSGGYEVLNQAAVVTLSLFVGLSLVVFFTKTNFSFLRTALVIGSIIAAGLIVAGIIFGFDMGLWFSVGMVVLAAIAILYQTSKLKYEYTTDQYVGASIGLFASLMLLFWYILRIFMSRD